MGIFPNHRHTDGDWFSNTGGYRGHKPVAPAIGDILHDGACYIGPGRRTEVRLLSTSRVTEYFSPMSPQLRIWSNSRSSKSLPQEMKARNQLELPV